MLKELLKTNLHEKLMSFMASLSSFSLLNLIER